MNTANHTRPPVADRLAKAEKRFRAIADALGSLAVDFFHHLALFAIGAATVWSAIGAMVGMAHHGQIDLQDILLLFIYLEIGAMIGIHFRTRRLPVRYVIYITITALSRLAIDIVGAQQRVGWDLLVVSGSVLILSLAVLLLRYGSYRYPSEKTDATA